MVHLAAGLATCALVFPLVSLHARERLTRRWSRKLLGLCRLEVEQVDGAPVLEHALIVANHVSWLDIFVINALHPCRFVAKAEIRAWPVLGWLAAAAGTVFIARGNRRELRHIFKGLVTVLQEGQRVAFFPEGTTSLQGELLPFHANLVQAAISAESPVQPVALRFVDQATGQDSAGPLYLGDDTLLSSLWRTLAGPPFVARVRFGEAQQAHGRDRRAWAEDLREAVDALRR